MKKLKKIVFDEMKYWNSKDVWDKEWDILLKDVKDNLTECPICLRILPNKNFNTNNGCYWCDMEYWYKKGD